MTSASDPLVQEIVQRRAIATLATHNPDGSAHLTSVWFLFEDGRFYVGTMTGLRKARNIGANPHASLMIDVREPGQERGVSVTGKATVVTGKRSEELNLRIHSRYLSPAALADPRVGGAFAKMDDITIELIPSKWTSWDMRVLGKQAFGDAAETPGYFLPLE
jgi:PPOX class probable F420-dependent enzyme